MSTISFRPNDEDRLILEKSARPGETVSDTLRRGLRLLAHDQWLEQFHSDSKRIAE